MVEAKHAYGLEHGLGAAEVILDEHLHEVEEHFGQSFLEELLCSSPVGDGSEDVDDCWLESVGIEKVGELLVGI